MTATNQQMTSQQLDELMVVAVSMQRDAEKLDERPVAVFAYAVQLALAELQQAKQQVLELSVKLANVESKCAVLAVENDRAVKAVTVFSNVTHDITEIICDELGQERVAEIVAAYNDLGNMLATYAYLAEVRAQARKEGAHFVANRMLAAWDAGFIDDTAKNAADIARMILTSTEFMADAPEGDFDRSFADGVLEDIAAQLRQGAEHE